MARRANAKAIGAFVIGAIALAVVAVLVLGSGRFFVKRHTYVLFFENNINGLRIGAPVKFKGVEVGSVTKILLTFNLPRGRVAFSSPMEVRIPVVIELGEGYFSRSQGGSELDNPEFMKQAISDGLRAQLGLESLLTGLLYVDLNIHPGSPANFVLPPGSHYQEIPTLPTALQQAQSAASRLIANLDKVDIIGLTESLNKTLNAIRTLADSPDLRNALASMNVTAARLGKTAESVGRTADRMNAELLPLSKGLRADSEQASITLQQARATLASIKEALEPGAPLVYQTTKTLKDVSAAAQAVSRLADYLEEHPAALVRGRDYGKDAK